MKNKLIFIILFMMSIMVFVRPVPALDLSVNILERYHNIRAGEAIYFEINVQEPERFGRHDISLEYKVKKANKVLVSFKELKAIETQASFIESIKIPDYAESGAYFLSVTIDESQIVEVSFNVRSAEEDRTPYYFLIIFTSMVVVGILVWFEIRRIRQSFEIKKLKYKKPKR